jgi:hypothetical protein
MFAICDKVVYLNTATGKFDSAEVKRVQIVPTGISKDEQGNNVLDGSIVLYETLEGPTLAESEVFATEEEARAFWRKKIVEI